MGDIVADIKSQSRVVTGWSKPRFFDLCSEDDTSALEILKDSGNITHVSDNIEAALEELFHIEYPAQIDSVDEKVYTGFIRETTKGNLDGYGSWVYFPWNGTLVHFPPKKDLQKLRGSRNRNLITDDERRVLSDNKTIVVLGLSVGSNAIDSLLMQGIGSRYILVDLDHLDPTNLNRIRASYDQLGIHKVDIVAKKISELDPYLEQVHYKNGLDEANLEEIINIYKPDIIMDEMDSLRLKILTRMRAKENKIPVLMATDDGDDILLDIERYDKSDNQAILHGILPEDVIQSILSDEQMSRQEAGVIIGKYFVNLENVPIRMLESLLEIGRTLPSWPQLGGAAVLSGLYLAYAAKKILLNLPLNSGRFLMGPEEQLNPEIKTSEYIDKKAQLIQIMTGGK